MRISSWDTRDQFTNATIILGNGAALQGSPERRREFFVYSKYAL